ncbi:hypothetical protein QFC20_007420 [Naganishia adeliensis]|uniref:Uncharacterized protein n=1 Tax=Naganishia adeliensis TaxID=92952 RepID=A0ACC2UZW3_9TREE|nr:hypothetical protein QFC20_007420 [Naganishia adeliensis]
MMVTPAKTIQTQPVGTRITKDGETSDRHSASNADDVPAKSHDGQRIMLEAPAAQNVDTVPLSAKGVKFQDGLSPGQGDDGETIIPGVDRHNASELDTRSDRQIVQLESKHRNLIERTTWTFIMIAGFIVLLCMGHPYMILLVMLCQTLVYKEVTALFQLSNHGDANAKGQGGFARRERWNKTLNWYFFVVTNYFLYGESIIYYFKASISAIPFGVLTNAQLLIRLLISHFIVNNILEGLIWFFVPASLVICNDVMAYVCGKLFGKTPLIKLSPKKTVEGFVGAFFCTLLFALIWQRYTWPNFLKRTINLTIGFRLPDVSYTPYHLHLLVMATFASLAAPFGGFFASGFKRAFDIKDFGHSIPGHGGMTDRMDCQFMMGLFAYVYYSSLIRVHHVNVGTVIDTIVNSLTVEEQLEVYYDLRRYLNGQGILSVSKTS